MSNPVYAAICEAIRDGRVIDENGALSLGDSDRLARAIDATDITAGEAVGLSLDNGAPCVYAYAMLAKRNIVPVPLAPTMPLDERIRLWRRSGCRYAINEKGMVDSVATSNAPRIMWPEGIDWIMHSSGSTGAPKAISVSVEALVRNAHDTLAILSNDVGALHVGSMSQCYTNGLYNSFMLPLLTGGRALMAPVATGLNLRRYLDLLHIHKPEILWVNPTVVRFLGDRMDPTDLSNQAILVSCTSALSRSAAKEAEDKLHRPVVQSYGLTETMIVSVEQPGRNVDLAFSSGMTVGGDKALKIHEDGICSIRNKAITKGYAAIVDGKVKLSLPDGEPGRAFIGPDLLHRDSNGCISIVGRRSNVINVQGLKISAEQLEAVAVEIPSVSDAVAVSVSDARTGEQPALLIIAPNTIDIAAVADYCAQKLGPKARPKVVQVTSEFPLTANGKIDRSAARARFEET